MELARIFLPVLIIMLIPLAGLASGSGPEAGQVVIVTRDYNGKEITLAEGAIFEVRLQQHSGTGFLWQIVDLDENHLKVLQSSDTPLTHGRVVGGPLLRTWKIQAVKAGQTNLRILLYRSWEGPEKAAESFQVKVRIQ